MWLGADEATTVMCRATCIPAHCPGLEKSIRLEWNRLNLDGVEHRDKHFP